MCTCSPRSGPAGKRSPVAAACNDGGSLCAVSRVPKIAQVAFDTTPLYYFGFLGLFMGIAITLVRPRIARDATES